jgi:hypothetical protein
MDNAAVQSIWFNKRQWTMEAIALRFAMLHLTPIQISDFSASDAAARGLAGVEGGGAPFGENSDEWQIFHLRKPGDFDVARGFNLVGNSVGAFLCIGHLLAN